jgi:predicted DNA-binding protein
MQRRTRRVAVNTRLDIETKRELVRMAEAEGRTLSDVARRMIERGLQAPQGDEDETDGRVHTDAQG